MGEMEEIEERLVADDKGLDERSRRVAKRLEIPLLIAAALTLPVTIVEESHLGKPWPQISTAVNWVIWGMFLAEMVIMLAVVPSKRRWLRTHPLEVAIVLLTSPALLTAVQAIRLLRLLRVFRLLRLGPLVRRVMTMEGLRYVVILAALTAVAGGAAFAAVEKYSFWNGLYWAITTMTTVGYGDIVPTTPEGKIIAVVVMLVGIGTATLLIGAVAQRFMGSKLEQSLNTVESDEENIMVYLRDIASRLERVEAALERQHSSRTDGE